MNTGALLNNVISIVNENNTTTSQWDVSGSLTVRMVQPASIGNPGKTPAPSGDFPRVFVSAESKDFEWSEIGRQARRDIVANLTVYAMTQMAQNYSSAVLENLKFADNLETMFHNYVDLSATVAKFNVTKTEYSFDESDATYVHTAAISIEAQLIGST